MAVEDSDSTASSADGALVSSQDQNLRIVLWAASQSTVIRVSKQNNNNRQEINAQQESQQVSNPPGLSTHTKMEPAATRPAKQ